MGPRTFRFPENIVVRTEAGLRAKLEDLAARDYVTTSELIRRTLRAFADKAAERQAEKRAA